MNIYVGNLAREVTDADLRAEFETFGKVDSLGIIKDKISGESRGFGFVEMSDKAEGQAAINTLNGKEIHGRTITVNEARPRTEDHRGGRGAGGGGMRGRRGGGGSSSGGGGHRY